jgi:hypothetical protein
MAGGTTPDAESLLQAFSAFGLDGEGALSRDQFIAMLTRSGKGCQPLNKAQATALYDRLVAASDGSICVGDFVTKCSAPHMPPNRQVPLSPAALQRWDECGGGELEPALTSGAIALLDAQWVVDYAARGCILKPRQALPAEAFISLDELKAATRDTLPVVCMSHCWLDTDHPDPRGHNLGSMARALLIMLSYDQLGEPAYPRLGVFYDFCSLHQRCRDKSCQPQRKLVVATPGEVQAPGTGGILALEADLFARSLDSLGVFYAHPATTVMLMTSAFPADYVDAQLYSGPCVDGAYLGRGWCFCESLWAIMTKDPSLVLDLGNDTYEDKIGWESYAAQCIRRTQPPVLPWLFEARLQKKRFFNQVKDEPLVAQLYRASFEQRFARAKELSYSELGWDSDQINTLANVFRAGSVPSLTSLSITYNPVGERGAGSLAASLASLPALQRLNLDFSSLGDGGAVAIAAELPCLTALTFLSLTYNAIGDAGAVAVAEAVGKLPAIEMARLDWNEVGDAGARALADALGWAPALHTLELSWNAIGTAGARALAEAVRKATGLRTLNLVANALEGDTVHDELRSAWGKRDGKLML